ncbi:restriction endonuclease subunit S [Lichenibacterium ramalinae]|nr:restriction endonuclease subunit S [Lichenibacterium ramalinae]
MAGLGDVTFAPMDALSDGVGGIDITLEKPAEQLATGSYNYFAEGDLLLAKVTPCFENGKKALIPKLPNRIGFATSEVHVIRPNAERIDPRYLRYLLSSATFIDAGNASMTGAGGLKRISDNSIKDFECPNLSLETQRRIADYLDAETDRIRDLTHKKRRQISLIHQKARQRAMVLAMGNATFEYSPTTGRPTRIIGLPDHWRTRRAGLLFQEVNEPNGDDQPILSVSIHHGVSDRQLEDEDKDRKTNLIEDRTSYKRIRPGYLVYNMMRAWQGGIGVSTVDGAVSPAYVVAKPRTELHGSYYYHLLRTPLYVEQMRQGSKGIVDFRLRLYWEQFRQILLPIPSLQEQMDIASQMVSILADADKVASKVHASLVKLKQYQTALITTAVHGELEVAGRAGSTSTDGLKVAL